MKSFLHSGQLSFQKNFVMQRVLCLLVLWTSGFMLGVCLLCKDTENVLLAAVFVAVAFFCIGLHLGYSLRFQDREEQYRNPLMPAFGFLSPFLALLGSLSIARVIYTLFFLASYRIGFGKLYRVINFDVNGTLIGVAASFLWILSGWLTMESAEKAKYRLFARFDKQAPGLN